MATQKQIEANRANAQKSTGAKTEFGKKISCMNAIKHGILNSDMSVYDKIKVEDIKSELYSDFQPSTSLEIFIIDRIAIHIVKLKRIAKAESDCINKEIDEHSILDRQGSDRYLGMCLTTNLLNTYSRYETTEENKLYKAIRELGKLRDK